MSTPTKKPKKRKKRKSQVRRPPAVVRAGLASPINPEFSYRLESDIVEAVIGLAASQRNEAIENGELPPPIKLTEGGRARAYLGKQLLEIQRRRLEQAEAVAAQQQTTEQPKSQSAGKGKAPGSEDPSAGLETTTALARRPP